MTRVWGPRDRAAAALPAGFGVVIDRGTKQLDPVTLFGGAPARVLRLSSAGRTALAELRAGPVRSAAAGRLARKLTDAGLAYPRPPELASRPDVTVLIPARDRAVLLDRCLSALGSGYPVVVVDDGSRDPGAVADVAAAHGAALVRRPVNGGPGAARNTGLLGVTTELVAFLDSDCAPEPGWIERLAAHLADPAVVAAAPRMVAVPAGRGWAGRYTTAACCLDLGDAEARVVPGTRVAYVPTAALVVRRAALAPAAGPGGVFDPALRWGEDVDLVWRLHDAGWRIRYDPAVRVAHHEPRGWAALLTRRFRYGTSAAPLAARHPGQVPPLVLHPWPAARPRPASVSPGRCWPCAPRCTGPGCPPAACCPRCSPRPGRPGWAWGVMPASTVRRCSPPRSWRRAGPAGRGAGPGGPRPGRCCWGRRSRPGSRGAKRWTRCGTCSATSPTTWPTERGCGRARCGRAARPRSARSSPGIRSAPTRRVARNHRRAPVIAAEPARLWPVTPPATFLWSRWRQRPQRTGANRPEPSRPLDNQ